MASAAPPNEEIDRIRREMARIRLDLHSGVQQTVEGVRSLTDFTSYIRNAPWLSLGLAVALGYIVVPRKKESGAEPVIRYVPEPSAVEERPRKKKGLLRSALGMVAPLAIRGAQHYAMQLIESYMASNGMPQAGAAPGMAASSPAARPRPAEPRSPGRPG